MAESNGTLTAGQQLREIIVAGLDLRYKYGLTGENPEKLIARKGMDYLDDLEKDAHLSSMLATRRQKLIEKGWDIKPYTSSNGKVTARNQQIRDDLMYAIEHMVGSFEKDIEGMLDALGKGFSISEINYQMQRGGRLDGKVGLKSIRFKPAKYFSFKYDDFGHYEIRQIDPNPSGVTIPRGKVIHLINGFNDENPYGDGLTAKCAFWVWLKKNQAKFWAIFNERFGLPLTRVGMPRKPQSEEITKAETIIEEIQTRAGIMVPEGFEVDFLEAARRGDITYDNFIERCNKEISKVVLGATLISEEGKRGQGSYALSTSHADILETYTIFDSIITQVAINEQLIRRWVDLNYQTDVYPKFKWSGMGISALISFAQALGVLAQNGMRIPLAWVHELSGIPQARDGEPALAAMSAAQGSADPAQMIGVDNRSAAFSGYPAMTFDDLPDEIAAEVIEVDLLRQRYAKQASTLQKQIVKQVQDYLKKKASHGGTLSGQ